MKIFPERGESLIFSFLKNERVVKFNRFFLKPYNNTLSTKKNHYD